MAQRSTGNPPILPLTVLALIMLALLPHRWSGWVGGLRGPFIAVIAPISGPLSRVSIWLREGETAPGEAPRPTLDALQDQLDQYKRLYYAELRRNEELLATIEDLQRGRTYPSPTPVDTLATTRVGRDLGAGAIEVRRGAADGVSVDAAVLTRRGEQLVGLVKRTSRLTSTVQLITDPALEPPLVVGAVMPAEPAPAGAVGSLPHTQLRPVGDGTLEDPQFGLGRMGGDDAGLMGRIVRVDDPTWPGAAQLLVIGRIVEVERLADRPLFRRLVVRPIVDVARQRDMLIRTPSDTAAEAEAGR